MCDCFHLAFPNWHASATGEGRRLKAPEQDTDDDLVCEEPEDLQGERPRPQGSSPVEEFPTTEKYTKQAEGDFYDSPTKSSKKGKRSGFGSLFDKRSSAKMNQTEDMQGDQSETIVKTVKEVCAEGLVVGGGGKDGIFIKEVKPESPASKHLNAKEGDQILSATVYFDNVSYEDALQILEHAQPYKVAFCLKRKPPPRTQEAAETMRPDITIGEEAENEEEGGGPEMRGRRKTKKQHDRISWPKFPTFSKSRRAHFKRSHSTSEAEEQRKLEISPPTSDTESPLKSPLKSPDGKEKKKMHKMKLKMKMAGRRSKSVEETENEEALTTDNLEVLDNQIIMNITEEQVPVINVIESPKILNEAEKTDSTKTRIEHTFPTSPVTESLHKVELISLDTTLKTTDITVALEEDGKEKREISELKVSLPGRDTYEIETESQLKSSASGKRTSDPSTFDNILDSPNILSQIEAGARQVDSESKPIHPEILEKPIELGESDMSIPKVNVSLDTPDVGPISKSPKLGSDKEKKEINILETESYGIRTRGPLADIATSKSHFANTVSGLEFTSSDTLIVDNRKQQDMSPKRPVTPTPVVSQPQPHVLDVDRSRKSARGSTDTAETKKASTESTFKLPKVDLSTWDQGESTTIGQRDPIKVPLLKREEIEIPGMEDKVSKPKVKSQRSNEPKIEKIINISKSDKARARGGAEEFNVEDVKEAVSKFPAFKLPDRDITGVLVQREITILEMKSDKTGLTPKGSPSKTSSVSTEINILLPDTMDKDKQRLSPVVPKHQTEQLNFEETDIAERKTEQSKIKLTDRKPKTGKMLEKDKTHDVKIKLPKREDIEIPGMEAIDKTGQVRKLKDTQDKAVKDYTDEDIKADRKGHGKKSKKGKVSLPSFGIMTPDVHFPGIAIELPIKAMSTKTDKDTKKTEEKIVYDEDTKEAKFEKPQKGVPELEKAHKIEVEHDVCIAIVKETSKHGAEGELRAEMKSKDMDSSPHKMKLPKLKMPKIGGKSVKGTAEVLAKEDITEQENDVIEVVLDSEKRTTETDPKGYSLEADKNWGKLKMPSIDVSVPKIKIPKTEGKSKQEGIHAGAEFAEEQISGETTQKFTKEKVGKVDLRVEGVEDTREESGVRLIKFGISMPKEKTEGAGLVPEESEQSIIKAGGKTEVEPSELPQGETKEIQSKMKKRKISFPKFGFSKSDSKASDADVTFPATQDVDGTEIDVGSKTTDVEAEFKDTKFRLPTIKLPKFGVSVPKTTDADADIQMPDVPDVSTEKSTVNVELPEAKFSVESTALSDKKGLDMTVSKPEVDLSLPGGKVEIKDISMPKVDVFQKKEVKSSEEISFSKPEVDAKLTDHDREIPEPVIKATGVDVSPPKVDVSIPKGSVEIKEPEVNFTISKDDAEDKNLTAGGGPVKFKLPSISLPKFGGKSSKVKDMPDIEEPDLSLPETEVSVKLKDDAPSVEVKDSFVTMEGQCVDMKVEEARLKEQKVTVTLPKFGISLPKVESHKPADSMDNVSHTDTKDSKPESDQVEIGSRSPTKIQLPTIKFPKISVSLPKSTDADFDNQETEVKTDEPTLDIKEPSGELPALPQLKTPQTTLIVSKPELDGSSDLEFSKPDVKMSLVDHGLGQKTALEIPEIQAKQLDMEIKLPSGTVDIAIPEAKEKESEMKLKKRKISFPKFGFSKSDPKVPDVDTSLQVMTAQDVEIKETEVTVPAPELEVQLKSKSTSGSPSKFKLPTISLPKFDISISKTGEESTAKVDGDTRGEIKKESAEALQDKDTGEQIGTQFSKPTFETLPEDAEIKTKDTDPGSQGSKFMMPKFEFSFPKIKGPEFKKGAAKIDTEKTEVTVKPEGATDIPKASVEMEVTSASMQAGEVDVDLDSDLKLQTAEMLKDDSTTGGSPIKFKLPSFKLPKFGSSSSKVKAEIADLKGEGITLETEDLDFSQEFKKPKVLTEVQASKAEADISLPEGKLWEPSADVEVPQVKPQHKIDQEADLKDPGMKMKRPGFSLPKFGFSKPEIEVNLPQVDSSKPEVDVKINEPSVDITASSVEAELKDPTFKIPSIKEEKTMPVVDISVKGPEVSAPDAQVKISGEAPSVDVKGPHLATEGQSISVDLKVEQVELGGKGGNLKMPKFGIGLPKVKGFDLSTKTEEIPEVQGIDIKQPEITTEVKVHPPEYDSKGLDVKMKTLPEFGLSKTEVKVPEVDPKIGSMDLEDVDVDIKVSKAESDQKGSTIFGSPTKFKLPSISLPKFGVKSQKVALDTNVTDSELDGATIKSDISKPDVKVEVQPPSIEAKVDSSIDIPEVDSKGPQVKVKRPSFSFPKFGFSKPDTATPEVDVSVPNVEVSIPEGTVLVKEQTAEITLPGMEAEQKDLTSVSSPTKFKLPEVNLPKFGVKTSKGAVSLPSAEKSTIEITTHDPNIKVSGQIPKMDVHVTKKDVDVHLAEGKIIIPQPVVDAQDMSIEGKADIPEVDLKGLDVKLKKPSFSFPKFGFSKPDTATPELDVSVPKVDVSIPEGTISVREQTAEITLPGLEAEEKDLTTVSSPTKFKLPEVNLPKFGVKTSKGAVSLPSADKSTIEITTPDPNIKVSGKIPKMDVHVTKKDVDVHLAEGKIIIPQPDIDAQDMSIEGKADIPEVDLKGLDVKLKKPSFSFPKFGFSKPDTATPEVDVSVPKVEVSIPEGTVSVKEQTAEITLPGLEAEDKDLTTVSSPTKFKLPEVNLPKFGVKTSKGAVSLPSADKSTIEITTHEPHIKMSGQIPKMEKEAEVHLAEGKIIIPQPDVHAQDMSIEGKADIPEVDLKGLDVKLKKPSFSFPKFGFSKSEKRQDVDVSLPKTDMSMQEGKDVELTFTGEVSKQEDPSAQTKFKLPSINLPKFGLKYPKATPDISTAEVDVKKPEINFPETGEMQTTDTKINIDIKGPTAVLDAKAKEVDIGGTGSTVKLPKFGISLPKGESKEINIETGLLCEGNVNVQQPDVAIQELSIEGKLDKGEVDSKGLKVKLPKLGFSKPDLKAPEIDVSLPKADMGTPVGNVDVSVQSADITFPEQEIDLKEDTFGSPTRFKLPTINFPKFGMKGSKDTVEISTAQIDIKSSEVSLPDKKLKPGEVSGIDVKGPTLNVEDPSIKINIKGDDKEQQEAKIKIPKFGIALPTIKGPDSEQGLKKTLNVTEAKISGDMSTEIKLPKGSVEVDIEAPQLAISQKMKGPEIDINFPRAEVKEVKPTGSENDVVDKPEDDMSSKGLKMKMPGFGFPKIGFSKSDGKAQDVQAGEVTADISLPEGTTEIEESKIEGKTEITSPQFGSPTKFKFPTIKLPKFGVSTPKVTIPSDSDIKDIKVSSVDYEIETTKLDSSTDIKGKTAEIETPSVAINIMDKEINQEVQETKFKIPKFGISLPKVKGPEVTVSAKEVKTGTLETEISEPEMKIPAEDVSLPEGGREVETGLIDNSAVSGSPSKFKLPSFKMPKFGMSAQKTSDAKGKVEADVPDNEDKPIQETTDQPPEAAVKKLDGEKGSPSKFKLPTIKMPKISISRTKSQDEDDTTINVKAPEAKIEPKDDSQGPGKSPRFAMPALEDVLKGFEVEFNVPTIEQIEAETDKPSAKQEQAADAKAEEATEQKDKGAQEKSKFKFKFPKLGFSQSSDESDRLVDAKIEESEKHLEALADVAEVKTAVSKEQAKTEKGGWFKFSFSSPTKTTKTDGKEEITQQPGEAQKPDDAEKESSKAHEEPEKSSLSEAVEEIISPTLSLRSSEAFADISSTVTTEQVALSQTSPTKVKVKYAEPTATVGINDVQSDVVTSTARCELISMEPHQPEKVNIPFSSDMSSTSVDTQKQISGEIHVITSNIQAVPDTHQAAILTNIDTRGIHTLPLLGSDSVLTVEETRVQSGTRTVVERHVVKETMHDDKETILVTHRTRIFEGDSAEPISDETASSIRRLRDTVHTEKMRFFDSVATTEEVTIVSSETTLRHMDSSTDENGGEMNV